uniref:Uncharacterized protein n=1 Tax=Physcomitrium patens TaxID=3218 RepID=A0A2K1KAE2_PHYPA|nr:hypothetical protein PHYPA_009932 [Physcomitrium patens]
MIDIVLLEKTLTTHQTWNLLSADLDNTTDRVLRQLRKLPWSGLMKCFMEALKGKYSQFSPDSLFNYWS